MEGEDVVSLCSNLFLWFIEGPNDNPKFKKKKKREVKMRRIGGNKITCVYICTMYWGRNVYLFV